jgi:hypothetical protein
MRFIIMVKSVDQADPFPEAFENAMAKFREETIRDGTLIDGSRLFPSEAGARVRLDGGKLTVTDGPFAETKELVGGYGLYEFKSKKEAVEFSLRFMQLLKEHWPGWEGETEIRQLFDESCAGHAVDGMRLHSDRARTAIPNHRIETGRNL